MVRLRPKVELSAEQLGEQRATCAAWSPHEPHDLILIGTHQSHVAVIRLKKTTEENGCAAAILSNVKLAGGAMRCVAWAHSEAFPDQDDCKHLCVLGSSQGFLVIYDIRDPFHVVLDLTTAPHSAPLCPL